MIPALRSGRWSVERVVPASPDDVWAVLTDVAAWPRWGPTVSRARLEHEGPLRQGSRGTVWTPVGVGLPFVVDDLLPGRWWSWRVAGVTATAHWVDPHPRGTVVGMDAPVWAPGYLAVLAVALRRIEEMMTP